MTAEQSRQTGGYYANQWTVRDEYAAWALPVAYQMFVRELNTGDYDPSPDEIAEYAGRIADAMLAERRRGSGKELANDIAEVLSLPKRDDPPAHEGEL